MKFMGKTIMFECKNYNKPVPTAEVTKFISDSINSIADICIMISMS